MSGHSSPRGLTRGLCAAVAGVTLGGLLALVPAPAQAAPNTLTFSPNDSDHGTYSANGVVMVSGSITFENDCAYYAPQGGVNDMFYPTSNVYIVPTGSVALWSKLEDAGGNGPNTIVGTTSGAFLGEMIAATYPSGTLGDGDYDVVFDTCQDGTLDRADEIFTDVISVDVPDGEIPPVDPSIRRLKDAAREQMVSWLQFHLAMSALFKLDDAKAIASCLLGPNPFCLIEVLAIIQDVDHSRAQHEDWIENMILGEMQNQAEHYGAIWKDPADPGFTTLPGASAVQRPEIPAAGQPVADALAGLVTPLAEEGALAEELLHALERYQGAQQAGDSSYALAQARGVRDVADTLSDQLADSSAVEHLAGALTTRADALVASAEEGEAVADRIRREGLTPAEQRVMTNLGLTPAEITDVERGFVEQGAVHAPTAAALRADLAALVAARAELREAVAETRTAWADHVDAMERTVEDLLPDADAGGPYRTGPDGGVHLSAALSQAGRDGAHITDAAWDLDGDGAYDDAHGFEVDATVATTRTVAVRVSDEDGHAGTSLAHVSRTGADRPPVVATTAPENAVTLTLGETKKFTVQASDPDGDALRHQWTYRGEVVPDETGNSLTLAADELGAGVLTVRVTGAERSAAHSWVVQVVGPDADGDGWADEHDCDDVRADIHPRAFERIGNGLDDDCDATSADAPRGGLAGSVMAWGYPSGTGLPVRSPSDLPYWLPQPVSSLGNRIMAIEQSDRGGFAVDVDGAVWGWGENFSGRVGDGTQLKRWQPVPVLGIGGEPGTRLTSARTVAAEWHHTLALLDDGGVVAWGDNGHGQLGTGDVAAMVTHPEQVVLADGSDLTGAVDVETGESGSYAVLGNGRVADWGVVSCDDDPSESTKRRFAAVNPLLGEHVVQVASGDGGGALVRREDGSLWSCGGYENSLGRDYTNADKAELRPVHGLDGGIVDVGMGFGVGAALDGEGRVWLWGRNTNHELDALGLDPGETQKYPAVATLPPGPPVVDLEVDQSTSIHAVRADGSVVTFGANTYGSSGTGKTGIVLTPPVQPVPLGAVRPLAISNAVWNGLVLVRPVADPDFEPAAQWVTAEMGDASIDEAGGGEVTLTLGAAAPYSLDVSYRVGDGQVRHATVPVGATSVALPVSVTDDALDEDDEVVPVTLTAISDGVRTTRSTGSLTVVDDDAAPTVSAGDRLVDEGDTTLHDVTVPVSLDRVSGRDVEVLWSAVRGGRELASGHALVPAGQRSVDVHVPLVGNTRADADDEVDVLLSDPVHATLGSHGTITVRDDDVLRLEVTAPAVTEGDSGTTPATFTVSVPGIPAGETVEVPWSVKAGTAEVGSDVADVAGTLSFDADHPDREVVVPVVGDRTAEALRTEVFSLGIEPATSSEERAVLPSDPVYAEITDDDLGLVVDAGVPVALDEGGTAPITGTADAPATWSVVGAGCTVAQPTALSTSLHCTRDGEAVLTLTADDGDNRASAAVGVTVRNLAPTVTITAPTAGSTVPVGRSVHLVAQTVDPGPLDTVTCTVDWGDGTEPTDLPGCVGDHVFTSTGGYTVTVRADDGQGGRSSDSVRVTVGADQPSFPFDGFYAPVDNPDTVNVVKAGSTVPVKFSLGGNRGLDVLADGSPASVGHRCDGGDPTDVLEQTTSPGAALLTYDATTGRYHLNWQTRKVWSGTCRTLVVTLEDGRSRTAEFRFR